MMGVVLRLVFLAPVACGTAWWEQKVSDARRCTSQGREVACLDVSTCERGAARKVAIVSVFDAHVAIESTCGDVNRTRCGDSTAVDHRLKVAALGKRAGVDVILVVPRRDLQREPIKASVYRRLEAGGVIVRYADWVAPPALSPGVPLESGGCCGAREFMKLYAFGFADYDALIVVDNDFDVDDVRGLRPIFDCAAAGHVITTRGAHSAMNGAFTAFPPSAALRETLLAALSTANARRPASGGLLWPRAARKPSPAGIQADGLERRGLGPLSPQVRCTHAGARAASRAAARPPPRKKEREKERNPPPS